MSLTNKENQDIISEKNKSIQNFSSQSISLSPEERKIKEDFFITYENTPDNNPNIKDPSNSDPFERLKAIEESINNKNKELKNINIKLNNIIKIEKEIQKPLTFSQKQEILEDNKIKNILNSNNISLGIKLSKISAKAKKIENELLYGGHGNINNIPKKEKLYEIKKTKEYILLKIKENDNKIKKINDKDKKNYFKQNQQIFLEKLEKIKENKNSNKYFWKKLLLLTDNNINANDAFNKCLYEEEIQKRINDEKIKKQKYKEMREKELEKIKHRKNIQLENERYIRNNNNWIETYAKNNNYLSWDEKEKERIREEEKLIILENNKRKIKFSPISSEELNNFSNDIKAKQLKLKNDLKIKKQQLEELWKERKGLIPQYKSKFEINNIKNDIYAKKELLLKKEQIKENILDKINFSLDVSKNYRPKLIISDKLKRERIEKINKLKGINRKNEIKILKNRLKLKSIKLVKSQPKNFKLDSIFKSNDSYPEKKIIENESENENIKENEDYLVNNIQNSKNILNDGEDIFNIEDNKNELKEEKNIYKIKKSKSNKVNKSSGYSDIGININNLKLSNNNINFFKLKEEKENKKYFNNIKTKLNILNQYIEK